MPSRTLGLTALIVSLACSGDATGPGNPLGGTWDVTTVLDAYKVEVPCPTLEYCTQGYPATGASLGGQIVIDRAVTDTLVRGIFTGAFCDTFDYTNGCTHVGSPTPVEMDSGWARLGQPGEAAPGRLEVYVRGPDDPSRLPYYHSYEHLLLYDITVSGDSAYGKLWWARTIARQPPGYEGTFVAHRR